MAFEQKDWENFIEGWKDLWNLISEWWSQLIGSFKKDTPIKTGSQGNSSPQNLGASDKLDLPISERGNPEKPKEPEGINLTLDEDKKKEELENRFVPVKSGEETNGLEKTETAVGIGTGVVMGTTVAGSGVNNVRGFWKAAKGFVSPGAEKRLEAMKKGFANAPKLSTTLTKGAKWGYKIIGKPVFIVDGLFNTYHAVEKWEEDPVMADLKAKAAAGNFLVCCKNPFLSVPGMILWAHTAYQESVFEGGMMGRMWGVYGRSQYADESGKLEEERQSNLLRDRLKQDLYSTEYQLALELGILTEEERQAYEASLEQEGVPTWARFIRPLSDEKRSQLWQCISKNRPQLVTPEQVEKDPGAALAILDNILMDGIRLPTMYIYRRMAEFTPVDVEAEARDIQAAEIYSNWYSRPLWRNEEKEVAKAIERFNKQKGNGTPEELLKLAFKMKELDVARRLNILTREELLSQQELTQEQRLRLYTLLKLDKNGKIDADAEGAFLLLETIPSALIQPKKVSLKSTEELVEQAEYELIREKKTETKRVVPIVGDETIEREITTCKYPKLEDLEQEEVLKKAEEIKLDWIKGELNFNNNESLFDFYEETCFCPNFETFPEQEKKDLIRRALLETTSVTIDQQTGDVTFDPPFEKMLPRLQQERQQEEKQQQEWNIYRSEQEETNDKFKNSRIQNPILLSKDSTPVYVGVDTNGTDEGVVLLPSDQAHYEKKELIWGGGRMKLKEGWGKKPYSLSCNGTTYQVVEMTDIAEMQVGDKKVYPSYVKGMKGEKGYYNLGGHNEMLYLYCGKDIANRVSALDYLRSSIFSEPTEACSSEKSKLPQAESEKSNVGAGALKRAQEPMEVNETQNNQRGGTL